MKQLQKFVALKIFTKLQLKYSENITNKTDTFPMKTSAQL